MFLELAEPDKAVETAVVAAPDLIVLTGAAAAEGGSKLLGELTARPETSSIPVALVQDDTSLDLRLRAFRSGAAAILPKKASVDELASKIAELAHEIPGRSDEALGELGEVTLEELVRTLGSELRSGILSVGGAGNEEAVRLVLGSGRPLAKLIEEFVQKTRAHVVRAEPLRYEFDARAGGTVQLLDADSAQAPAASIELDGLRVVLADDNTGRADAVAGELRRHGAEVIVSDLAPSEVRFAQMRQADPGVLLIGEEHIQAEGYELVRRMRRDTRLRWTSLLVVRWDELLKDTSSAPVERLATSLKNIGEPEANLREQAEANSGLDARLEMVGPARSLRSLSQSSYGWRVTVTNPRLWAELDLANGLVVGAVARTADGERSFEGAEALAALLQLSSGRLQIDHVEHPARANVMATVDMALSIADGEAPPIMPSIPAGPPSSPAPFVPPPAPAPAFVESEPPPSVRPQRLEQLPSDALFADLGMTAAPEEPSLKGPPSSPPLERKAAAVVHTVPPSVRDFAPAAEPPVAVPVELTTAAASQATASRPVSPRGAASAIDERLRRLLGVDENGLSPSLLAVLGALALLELFWILLLIAAAAPSQTTQLEAAPGGSGPLAQAPAPIATSRDASASAAERARNAKRGTPALPLPVPDGSGAQAPTCDALLAGQKLKHGQFPGIAFGFARQGKQALVSGRLDDSHDLYCRAAHYDKSSPSIWLSLAQVYMLKRDGARAADAATRGVALAPNDTALQAVLADALARGGVEIDRARSLWIRAARLDETDPQSRERLARRDALEGERATRRSDYVYAERMYRRVALLAPEKVNGAVGLSRALLALKETGPAGKWADYATSVEPGNADPHLARGDVLAAQGLREEARREWELAVRLDPALPDALARLR
jgi:tetratricopeptide (TPR) repeat protein/DNA-binding NarL/FixJ family response regulator